MEAIKTHFDDNLLTIRTTYEHSLLIIPEKN
jgi:hypothetical protein